MNTGRTVLSQLMDFLPKKEFQRCAERYKGSYHTRFFSCWDQFLCMAFAQLSYRESLRDIECCLRSMQHRLYHMDIRRNVSRSTLADANEKRDWRIYADFAQVLIHIARDLYSDEEFGLELHQTVYALDASTIDLCLSLFPWAKFRKTKGAIKLHTLLDLRGNIPSFISITDGKVHEVTVLDELIPEPGAFYIMDRGYLDFTRLVGFISGRLTNQLDYGVIKLSLLLAEALQSNTLKNCAGSNSSMIQHANAFPFLPITLSYQSSPLLNCIDVAGR